MAQQQANAPGARERVAVPSLLDDLRARVDYVRGQLAASRGNLSPQQGEPTAQVPVALLERMQETVAALRDELASLRGDEAAEGRPAQPEPSTRRRFEARKVALNMALNGAVASEIECYLARNFACEDAGALAADACRRVDTLGAE